MKKLAFLLAYAATLVVPAAIYIVPLGGISDGYSLSVAFGTVAFGMFANPFLLAARPRPAVSALGAKGLLSFHGSAGFAALLIAFTHRSLKVGLPGVLQGSGFTADTPQALFGLFAFTLFAFSVFLAAFFMANTFWMKIAFLKRLKERVWASTGLSYPRMRVIHNLVVLASIAILLHVLLASTSDFSGNPAASVWMAGWMAFCLGSYAKYRLSGRRGGSVARERA